MKPSDYFLGVVNFLGVLVPGAALLFLRQWDPTKWNKAGTPISDVLIYGAVAYVIGQILLAVTEIFNEAVPFFRRWIFKTLHDDVVTFKTQALIHLNTVQNESPQSIFHRSLSYLRVKNAAGSGEVDHLMADYKLLRNFVVVLAVDGTARFFCDGRPGPRYLWAI